MCVLTDETKEGLSQLSVGALGDCACAFCMDLTKLTSQMTARDGFCQ